jgi:similar to stage IV sporulation protein
MEDRFTFTKHIKAELVIAEPVSMISKLAENGFEMFAVTQIDLITVRFTMRRTQYAALKQMVENNGGTCKPVDRSGYLWRLDGLKRRPVLVAGVLIFALLAISMSERILFVDVVGSESVPKGLILQQAVDCGISIGRTRRAVRSEEVKNALLSNIPQLQWVGVNTRGNVATIHVKERSRTRKQENHTSSVSGIVASRDGVISKVVIYKGTQLCKTGDSVKKDDQLVSGYTDCGLKVVAQNADAEIFAYTLHDDAFISPYPTLKRTEISCTQAFKSLRIGKKVIKLYNHSGIPDVTCVKMYSEEFLTLPGGFQLPVSIISEEYKLYDSIKNPAVDPAAFSWIRSYAGDYLKSQMISGEIIRQETNLSMAEGACFLETESVCEEMIGQVKYEETLNKHAEDN